MTKQKPEFKELQVELIIGGVKVGRCRANVDLLSKEAVQRLPEHALSAIFKSALIRASSSIVLNVEATKLISKET